MADESRWSEGERFGRRDQEPRYGGYRDHDREFGRFDRGRQDYGRDRYDWLRYGRDSGEPYRGYERETGRGELRGRDRPGSREDRHWWERASDEISSWFGDDEAGLRRARDAADQGHRGRGPKGYVRSDERIREDVCDRLCDDSMVDASNIDVAVAGSEVTLSGTVESRDERRRAEDCAERVSGVLHVQNNLRVAPPGAASGTTTSRTGAPARSMGTPPGRAPH